MKFKHSLLIACLGTAPLCAQQVDPKTPKAESSATGDASATATVTVEVDGVRKTETHTSRSGKNQPPPGNAPGQPSQNQKPATYIGVMTREVSPELRSQFSLPEGFGIMVDEVMPDSPAQHAGIKAHDILLKFEDQQLVNMEQLMLLVRAKKKGDVVNLTVISGGQEKQVPVTLGEHLMPAIQHRQHQNFAGMPSNPMFFSYGNPAPGFNQGFQNQSKELNEQMQRFQKEMQEYQRRIQDWARQNNGAPMPQPPAINLPGNQPPPAGIPIPPNPVNGSQTQQLNFTQSHTATNITRRDDTGEYTLKTEDGKTTFIARPNNGKEQSWPVNTDAERNAVPQEFRDKLRMMNGAQGGIHIQIQPSPNGGGAPKPPSAPGGAGMPKSPANKPKPTTSA